MCVYSETLSNVLVSFCLVLTALDLDNTQIHRIQLMSFFVYSSLYAPNTTTTHVMKLLSELQDATHVNCEHIHSFILNLDKVIVTHEQFNELFKTNVSLNLNGKYVLCLFYVLIRKYFTRRWLA